jgi:Flp pilus assembly protein TadD
LYEPWKKLFSNCTNKEEVFSYLVKYFKDKNNYKGAAAFCLQLCLVCPDVRYRLELERLYILDGDLDHAIGGWKSIVSSNPDMIELHFNLIVACLRKGGHAVACQEWRELKDRLPVSTSITQRYNEVRAKSLRLDGWEGAVAAMMQLVHDFPSDCWYGNELRKALSIASEKNNAVSVWGKLVRSLPHEKCLHEQLSVACRATGDTTLAVEVWHELIDTHPDRESFYHYLNVALKENGNTVNEITLAWRKILLKHVAQKQLQSRLYPSMVSLGTQERESVWVELVSAYPVLEKHGPPISPNSLNDTTVSRTVIKSRRREKSPEIKLVGMRRTLTKQLTDICLAVLGDAVARKVDLLLHYFVGHFAGAYCPTVQAPEQELLLTYF